MAANASNIIAFSDQRIYSKAPRVDISSFVGDDLSTQIDNELFGLVVDDDEIHGELVSHVLDTLNIKATLSCTWTRLERIKYKYCCIIVLDLNMPEASGIEILTLFAQKKLEVPIIIYSGAHLSMIQTAATYGKKLGLNIVAILQKPFNYQELHDCVQRMSLETNAVKFKVAQEYLQLAAQTFLHSSEAIVITNEKTEIITVNPAFTRITGYPFNEVVGKNPKLLSSGLQEASFYQDMWFSLNSTGSWQGEIWNRRKNGEVFLEYLSISTVYDEVGSPFRRIAQFFDITRQDHAEELIWKKANFDPLTDLPNRCMFHDRLGQEIKKSRRNRLPFALMLLDLDRFKEVNDTHGHSLGDLVLKQTAARIQSCVRTADTVCRLGGDEFIVILGDLEDIGCVESIAQKLCETLSDTFLLGDYTADLSVSIGITFYPDDTTDMETLIGNADRAMYAAKQQGRNRYAYFTPTLQEATQIRRQLIGEIHAALKENQFEVYYQPIVALADGAVHKAEALIRWRHPERGLVCPGEFIPTAEETGLVVHIDNWVFHEVVRQWGDWQSSACGNLQISMNVSPAQFHNENRFCATWPIYLQGLGYPGSNIVLEITEGLLLDTSTVVIHQFDLFHSVGMQVAIDDFGTGYSSLAYIKKFAVDYIKIDQSFVRNLRPDSTDMALCKAIIVMAHELGLQVIAEGVETQEQHDLLRAMDCDYAQGYFFSHPLPVAAFSQWHAARC